MLNLFILLSIATLIAILVMLIPFARNHKILSKSFIITLFSTIFFSFTLYSLSGNKQVLYQWLTQGKKHYELQEKVRDLGGIDGMISRIQKKLEENPQDAQGWFILGKLYYMKNDYQTAQVVLKKALTLDPGNKDISKALQLNANKKAGILL